MTVYTIDMGQVVMGFIALGIIVIVAIVSLVLAILGAIKESKKGKE